MKNSIMKNFIFCAVSISKLMLSYTESQNLISWNSSFSELLVLFRKICDALRDLITFVQFKNVKNTHGGVLLLVNAKINTPLWVFSEFLKLQKWYQILQLITNISVGKGYRKKSRYLRHEKKVHQIFCTWPILL